MPERTITFEIKEHVGTITHFDSGWNRELNLVSWNGGNPKYDIRDWDDAHVKMSKGLTFHPDEMRRLVDLYLADNTRRAVERGKALEAVRKERRAEYRRDGGSAGSEQAGAETPFAETSGGAAAQADTGDAPGPMAASDTGTDADADAPHAAADTADAQEAEAEAGDAPW